MRKVFCGLIVALSALPSAAWACGGCFAPAPPGSDPRTPAPPGLVQSAERVLFVQDPATKKTRVWIEIRYNGPAQDFAWVLPLPKAPKVGVGSSWLLDRLDLATMPRFFNSAQADENCADYQAASGADASGSYVSAPRTSYGGGCGGGSSEAAGYSVTTKSAGSGSGTGTGWQNANGTSAQDGQSDVQVIAHDQAGPYDWVLLDGKDPAQVSAWLLGKGYAVPPAALPILAAHVAKGDVFLALRLKNGAGASEIRPIALEMDNADACVPLRLTSIAAAEDTSVVVFVAGPGRAVPKNYLHVQVNPARIAWLGGVGNYDQVLSTAIDEAAGRAFATEFAGTPDSLTVESSLSLLRRRVRNGNDPVYKPGPALVPPEDAAALAVAPFATVSDVQSLGTALGTSGLFITDPIGAVLEKNAGLAQQLKRKDIAQVYIDLQTMALTLTPDQAGLPVAGKQLAADLKAVVPSGEKATSEMLAMIQAIQAQPRMTRLALLISPGEMTKDPVFAFNPTLADVKPRLDAQVNAVCTTGWYPANATRLTLPGLGSWVFPQGTSNAADPRFASAPAALRAELADETGDPQPIAAADVDLVDQAIAGAQPGKPTLSGTLTLHKAPSAWQPPPSDPIYTQKQVGHGGWAGSLSPRDATWLLAGMAVMALATRRLRRSVERGAQ